MSFGEQLWHEVGITWAHGIGVVISSVVMYVAISVVLRVWGQRLFANRSGTGVAVVLVLGAIVGRSMLGPEATLLGGLLCLATLVTLEWFFGAGRRAGLLGHRSAVVIYANAEFKETVISRFHLDRRVIWARLRQAGISHLDHVRALILETDGTITVLRQDTTLDARLLTNVRGASQIS